MSRRIRWSKNEFSHSLTILWKREADDVAATIMRMAAPGDISSAVIGLDRKCAKCEEEDDGEKLIQTRRETSGSPSAGLDPDRALRVTQRSGRELSSDVRSHFEPDPATISAGARST